MYLLGMDKELHSIISYICNYLSTPYISNSFNLFPSVKDPHDPVITVKLHSINYLSMPYISNSFNLFPSVKDPHDPVITVKSLI